MNGYSLLELTLGDILRVINPMNEDWSIRFHIINELQGVVQSIENLRGATVEPYGSFVSNLFTRWGDLDVSVELHNGSYISSAGKKHKQSLLEDILKALRRKGGWRRLQFIPNARVPILKLESHLNISCDISINNLVAQMKSKLLFWINEIDGRFRDIILLVKEWAKAHDINDSTSGTLNSYCLSLLVVFHFQTCVPAILPPLKEIYPGNIVDDLTGVRAVAEKHIEETCAVNINRLRSDRSRIINASSLSELFVSFLAKFCDISLRAPVQGISTYSGQWEDIGSNMRRLPKTCALFVEDPFEQPANSAMTVSNRQLTKISEAVQTTHRMLLSAHQSQNSIISTLLRPHISQFVARTPARNLSNNGGDCSRAQPLVHAPGHSPLQLQQQFQNMRIDGRPRNGNASTRKGPGNGNASTQKGPGNGNASTRQVPGNGNASTRQVPGNGNASTRQALGNASMRQMPGNRNASTRQAPGNGNTSTQQAPGNGNASTRQPVRALHNQGQQLRRPRP
ncbi:unnamed protein product [Ilex paraguariensis]|uniref:Poly(A) RNA polymerase mitochondrial-like central palm domain-containing protein n=1 Tax=Ilex paraguariensis TaxID=185542 RepID=A0ABC8QT22_9AQUA